MAQDLQSFPRFAELKGQGIEAILGPGDLLWGSLETLRRQLVVRKTTIGCGLGDLLYSMDHHRETHADIIIHIHIHMHGHTMLVPLAKRLRHIPPGWWHHVEMLPSPRGEAAFSPETDPVLNLFVFGVGTR